MAQQTDRRRKEEEELSSLQQARNCTDGGRTRGVDGGPIEEREMQQLGMGMGRHTRARSIEQ